MTAIELKEALEEIIERYGEDMEVRVAYQPSWPLSNSSGGVKVAKGGYGHGGDRAVYVYESATTSGEYAPDAIYNGSDDWEDEEDEDDWEE